MAHAAGRPDAGGPAQGLTPDGQKAHDGPHVVIARVGPLGRAEEATQAAFLGFGSERLEVALDEFVPM